MESLQKFSYRDSLYHRPTQKWVCGRASEGLECEVGPDGHGRCIAKSECNPHKEGSRWICTRSAKYGGVCPDGPRPDGTCCLPIDPPCNPVRSWRSKRAITSRWLFAAILGVVLLFVGQSGGGFFISPGELSVAHSTLSDCGVCHTAFAGGPKTWLHEAFVGESDYNDSRACLDCHNIGSTPLKQHGIEARQHITSEPKGSAFTEDTPGTMLLLRNAVWELPEINTDSLTCATCHGEHSGSNIALNEITNQTCLECHGDKFTSFSQGHPGYETYPYKRRTRINFDHGTHFDKHFQSGTEDPAALRSCGTCHKPDNQGKLMVLAPFENACGECHTNQIEGVGKATTKGIAILSLPDIDTWTLAEQTIPIGNWPEQTDGSLTPFMELLLSNNAEYQRVKPDLEGLDLTDLSDASPDQLAAVEVLVWAIKDLFLQTQRLGAQYLRSQLEYVLGPLTTTEAATLTASMSKGVIQGAQDDWFPNIEHEISLKNSGQVLPSTFENSTPLPESNTTAEIDLSDEEILLDDEIALDDDEIDFSDEEILLDDEITLDNMSETKENLATPATSIPLNSEDWAATGGWYKDNNTYTLRYRPVSHADTFLKGWLDMSSPMAGEAGIFADLFNSLSKKTSAGSCAKCHSVDRIDQSRLLVNWKGVSPATIQHNLAQYSHVSHFQVMDERGCKTCHEISTTNNSDTKPSSYDPSLFDSNFTVLNQKICADCHRVDTAMDSCITCHQYHFIRPQSPHPSTALLSGQE